MSKVAEYKDQIHESFKFLSTEKKGGRERGRKKERKSNKTKQTKQK